MESDAASIRERDGKDSGMYCMMIATSSLVRAKARREFYRAALWFLARRGQRKS